MDRWSVVVSSKSCHAERVEASLSLKERRAVRFIALLAFYKIAILSLHWLGTGEIGLRSQRGPG